MQKLKDNKKMIKGRVPVRLGLAGGGTDVSPYTEMYGGAVLNVTINKYIFGSLKKRNDNKIVLISGNENKIEVFDSINYINLQGNDMLPLKAVVKKYHKGGEGLELYVHSEVPISSGVGGSASLFVLLISLFNNYNKSLAKDQYEIAEEAHRFERVDLKNHGGRQDQYAAIFGGLNYMEFNKEDFVKVNRVMLNEDTLRELETNLLLFYIGERKCKSGDLQEGFKDIISDQKDNLKRNQNALKAMHRTKEIAKEMKALLIKGNLDEFGRKLHEAWEEKKKCSSMISNFRIDELYADFKNLGSLGGKVSGAGGGGHMMIYAPLEKHHEIIEKAKESNIKHIPFRFDNEGLKLWTAESKSDLDLTSSNFKKKVKAVFLDRDGVINEEVGLLHKKNDIKVLPGVKEALTKLKDKGYKLVVVSNQPIVARGLTNEEGVEELNSEINWQIDCLIDEFYFCPHHPNADLEDYKKICDCRKPSPGMILQAANDLNIELRSSWMIGDRLSDIAAGKNAGCKTILIESERNSLPIESGAKLDENVTPNHKTKNLLEASNLLLGDVAK